MLALSHVFDMTTEALKTITENCVRIETLHLSSVAVLDDDGIECVARNLVKLQDLDISGSSVTDAGLQHIGSYCKVLERIQLNQCSKISDAQLENTVEKLKASLKHLCAAYLTKISSSALTRIREKYPSVIVNNNEVLL